MIYLRGGWATMGRDNILHIKGTLERRKREIKSFKIIKGLVVTVMAIAGIAGIVFAHSQKTVYNYYAKSESLNSGFQELENKKSELEIEKNEVENQKEELKQEQERILSEAEIVAQNILPKVSKKEDIPVLELVIDEQTGKLGNITRIEAFVDLIKRRKMRKDNAIAK